MQSIVKANETMTSRERVRRTFNYERTDRVTIGYETNPIAHKNLCRALGMDEKDILGVKKLLGVDYIGVSPQYRGSRVYDEIPDRVRNIENGAVMRYIENNFGGYWDYCDFPLKDADDELIYNYPFPDPDNFDYESATSEIDYLIEQGFSVHVGGAGLGDILNTTGMIMGVEDALVNISTDHEATLHFLDKRLKMQLDVTERMLELNKGKLDFVWIGEDLGTQHTQIISRDLYNRVLRPRHQKFIDLAKAYKLPVIIHTCGSSSWVYEEFITMGMSGVDTLQPEAANMSPAYLSEHFGGRLNFRGCISTAGPLAYGTPEEVTQYCKDTLEIMMKTRGYHFAPTHEIQDNSPAANIIAMYNAAHKYGTY